MVTYRRANRQYVAMTEKEVWDFLESSKKIFVSYTMPDGTPHISPVWFCVIGKRIYFRTQDYKMKGRLADSSKVCLSIDAGDRYRELKGVVIWGRSKLISDKELERKVKEAMDKRYEREQWRPSEMPKAWVDERTKEKRVYVEIIPEKVSSWDNSKV